MYLEYKFFIIYVFCKYFIPIEGVSFYFLSRVLHTAEVLNVFISKISFSSKDQWCVYNYSTISKSHLILPCILLEFCVFFVFCLFCHQCNILITVLCLAAQLCLTLCNPMDCSPPVSSVHGDSPGKNTAVSCHALRCINTKF